MPKIQEKSSNRWSIDFSWWKEEKNGLGQNQMRGESSTGEERVSLSQEKKEAKERAE